MAADVKILKHDATVIASAQFHLVQLSELALPACNKPFRQYRKTFAQKISKESFNIDVLNQLMLYSLRSLSCMGGIKCEKK